MRAAMRVEALKLTHSLVGLIATLAVVAGMLALLGGITAGVAGGNPELVAKAGPAGTLNWDGLLAGAAQITAVASILGFGIVLAWMFGREFTEGTVTGLFALPVSRTRMPTEAQLIAPGFSMARPWARPGKLWMAKP